jgi:hypothetical protein
MRVAVVQQFVRSLALPLEGADFAAAKIKKLDEVGVALEPFKEMDLTAFAELLRQAEEYKRTGILPVKARRSSRPKTPKAPPVTDEDIRRISQEIMQLAERAIGPEMSREALEAELNRINLPQYNRSVLLAIAREIGLSPKARTTAQEAIDAIRQKILGRKEAYERMTI